jgi:hypothetical protein
MKKQGPRCSLDCIDTKGKPRHLLAGSKPGICSVCKSNLAYWKRQPPSRRILRTARVRLYVRRMEQVS